LKGNRDSRKINIEGRVINIYTFTSLIFSRLGYSKGYSFRPRLEVYKYSIEGFI